MMHSTFSNLLKNYFKGSFTDTVIDQFASYLELLSKWNKAFNLTAIKDPFDMVILHIADSLSINPYLRGKRIIDVGSGAGLPGIPLAIINPDKKFTLLDSNNKKTCFLTQVIAVLKLTNVEIINSRAENYTPDDCFELVLSRAFASLAEMLKVTRHLCCKNGQFLAMKGVYPADEINDLTNAFIIDKIAKLEIPNLKAERHLVRILHAES